MQSWKMVSNFCYLNNFDIVEDHYSWTARVILKPKFLRINNFWHCGRPRSLRLLQIPDCTHDLDWEYQISAMQHFWHYGRSHLAHPSSTRTPAPPSFLATPRLKLHYNPATESDKIYRLDVYRIEFTTRQVAFQFLYCNGTSFIVSNCTVLKCAALDQRMQKCKAVVLQCTTCWVRHWNERKQHLVILLRMDPYAPYAWMSNKRRKFLAEGEVNPNFAGRLTSQRVLAKSRRMKDFGKDQMKTLELPWREWVLLPGKWLKRVFCRISRRNGRKEDHMTMFLFSYMQKGKKGLLWKSELFSLAPPVCSRFWHRRSLAW